MKDQTYYGSKPVNYSADTIAKATHDAIESARDHIRRVKADGGRGHLRGEPYLYQTDQGSNILQDYTYQEARHRVPRDVVAAALIHFRATEDEQAEYNRQVPCQIQKISEHLWYCSSHGKNNTKDRGESCGALGLA